MQSLTDRASQAAQGPSQMVLLSKEGDLFTFMVTYPDGRTKAITVRGGQPDAAAGAVERAPGQLDVQDIYEMGLQEGTEAEQEEILRELLASIGRHA